MIDLGNGVEMVTRAEWGARPARSRTDLDATYGSTGHWEGPTMGSFPHASCATKVRAIQNFHMDSRGWQDIAYSLLVCPHDYVFQGRGPNVRTAANGTNVGNNTAGAVCYLGGVGDGFTGQAAMRAGFDYLDRAGHGPRRNGHRDWKPTQCPGDTIYEWIHDGQPVPGPGPTPPPTPGPTPPVKEDDMLHLVKGDKTPEWYFTDLVSGRRHCATTAQAARAIWHTVAAGGNVATDGQNGPVVYPEADLASLPVIGAVEQRTELRVEAVGQELERLTREVRAWQDAVSAALAAG